MTHHDDKDWEFGPVFKGNLAIVCTAMILIEVGWVAMLYQGLPRPLWSEASPISLDPCSHAISKDGAEFISRPCALKAHVQISEKSEARDPQGALYRMLPPCPDGQDCINAQVEAMPQPRKYIVDRKYKLDDDGQLLSTEEIAALKKRVMELEDERRSSSRRADLQKYGLTVSGTVLTGSVVMFGGSSSGYLEYTQH